MGRNYDQVFQDAKHALGAPGKQVIPTAFNIDRYGPIFAFRLM